MCHVHVLGLGPQALGTGPNSVGSHTGPRTTWCTSCIVVAPQGWSHSVVMMLVVHGIGCDASAQPPQAWQLSPETADVQSLDIRPLVRTITMPGSSTGIDACSHRRMDVEWVRWHCQCRPVARRHKQDQNETAGCPGNPNQCERAETYRPHTSADSWCEAHLLEDTSAIHVLAT